MAVEGGALTPTLSQRERSKEALSYKESEPVG